MASGCTGNIKIEFPDGATMESVPHYAEADGLLQKCHDCNVMAGNSHHPGCDMERCPKCKGQLISCGCLDNEED